MSKNRVALSPRQSEIVRLMALGYTDKAIADHLKIARPTVETHKRTIFARLRVVNRAQAVYRFYFRHKVR